MNDNSITNAAVINTSLILNDDSSGENISGLPSLEIYGSPRSFSNLSGSSSTINVYIDATLIGCNFNGTTVSSNNNLKLIDCQFDNMAFTADSFNSYDSNFTSCSMTTINAYEGTQLNGCFVTNINVFGNITAQDSNAAMYFYGNWRAAFGTSNLVFTAEPVSIASSNSRIGINI